MTIATIFALICLVYGIVLLFSGFVKSKFMIKMAKIKFGKNLTDEKAIRILYIFGVLLLVAAVILFIV